MATSNNKHVIRRRCKSKRARSHRKRKHHKIQSLGQYIEAFEDNIRSYHLKYGFKNQHDFEQCINIHLSLLSCPLIISCQPQLDQWIIKEIAVFATGLCIQCKNCKSDHCILYHNTLNDDTLKSLCQKHHFKYTPLTVFGSIQTKIEFSKSLLQSINYDKYDKVGYINNTNDSYICGDCLPNELAGALQSCDCWRRESYYYRGMEYIPDPDHYCECYSYCRCYTCDSDYRWEYSNGHSFSFDDHQVAMDRYYFATDYNDKIDIAGLKCDEYLSKLEKGKKRRNFMSLNTYKVDLRCFTECEVCEGTSGNTCRFCNGIGLLNTKKIKCTCCEDWRFWKKEKFGWTWCDRCDNKGFHLILVSWINDIPIDMQSYLLSSR